MLLFRFAVAHVPALHMTIQGTVVFFKDSWCVNADDIFPEGEIYSKLAAKKVLHVPHCLASGDVEHLPKQKPQAQKYS